MRLYCLLAVLLLFALPGGLGAQTRDFQIPFDFIGYGSDFHSGHYSLSRVAAHILKMTPEDPNNGFARYLVTRPKGNVQIDGRDHLVFEKVGDFHVLREFRSSGTGASVTLPLSKERRAWEKTYTAKNRGEFVLIAAN
ncbi:MAG: hypothetical protein IH602_01470 [Bryobacteraceae bacterium]|nr:hypothetical protein [Bryobacteraceae bacterium]